MLNMDKYTLANRLRFHAANGESAWTTVYLVNDTPEERQYVSCVLADKKMVEEGIEELGWFEFHHDFKPKFSFDNKDKPTYTRYGTDKILKPIIIERSYKDFYPKEIEISEEFRHFFNIYVNGYKEGTYVKIDEYGEEDEIVKFKADRVEIKTEYLKEYAAAKELEILVIFEYFRYFTETLKDIGISPNQIYHSTDEQLNFQVCYQTLIIDNFKSNARLLGKKWIRGLANYKPQSLYDTIDKENFEDFIVKLDDSGKPVYKSCNTTYDNPDKDARFLTPIYFKREVLRKYYENPNRYEVRDRTIDKKGGWYLPLDNNKKEYVVVFLGDLGRNLPTKEQIYWKSYNISPMGYMSKSYFENSIEGKFSSPELSEFIFKDNYEKVNNAWQNSFGFPLFIKLHKDDEFHLQTLRVPLIDSVNEFDNQVLSLIKQMIDSINEKEICRSMKPEYQELVAKMKNFNPPKTPKGLDKLELFLQIKKYPRTTEFIQMLRNIQELRSTSVAHRKGENYEKNRNKFDIGNKSYVIIFDEILANINSFLDELISLYEFKIKFVSNYQSNQHDLKLDE